MIEYQYEEAVFHSDDTVELPEEAVGVTAEFNPRDFGKNEVIVRYLLPTEFGGKDER